MWRKYFLFLANQAYFLEATLYNKPSSRKKAKNRLSEVENGVKWAKKHDFCMFFG